MLKITLMSSGVIGGPVAVVGVVVDDDPTKETEVSVALALDSSDGVENQVELELLEEPEPEDERVDVVFVEANDGFEALEDTFALAWDIEFERECGWWDIDVVVVVVVVVGG